MRYPEKEQIKSFATDNKAYIRFLHAVANEPPVNVDVYVNNRLIVKNFKYEDFTEYLPAKPGTYIIQVYPTGNRSQQVLETRITLDTNEIATAAIIGTVNSVDLEVFSDYHRKTDETMANMRFINIASDKTPVNIYVDDKPVVYDLQFTEATEFIPFNPGKHTMKVEIADTNKAVVYHPNMVLKAGNYYATYVVGFSTKVPYMEVLIPLEGVSYLEF